VLFIECFKNCIYILIGNLKLNYILFYANTHRILHVQHIFNVNFNGILKIFVLYFQSDQMIAVQHQPRVTLQKKDESSAKALSETLLAKLRPFRGSTSSVTLAALTGLDPLTSRKDDGKLLFMTICRSPNR
jgi:hypothetical protein